MRQSPPPLTRDRVVQLIQRMKSSRVVVVGDIMLDRYLIGDTERLSPEAPVPVVTVRERHSALGGAANVAANVVALGARCLLVGAVGDDVDGATIRQELAVARLEDRHVLTVAGRPTTSKTRIIARGQQIVRIDDEVDTLLEGPDLGKADRRCTRGAGRRRCAAPGGLQQGRAVSRPDHGGDGGGQAPGNPDRGRSQVPPVLRVLRRHRLQAQPPGAGVCPRRGGGPPERRRATRGAHPAQGGQSAGDVGSGGNGAA